MSSDKGAAVLVQARGPVRVVRLNRPQRLNAIDAELADALLLALRSVAEDDGCRCVVLLGSGRAFCVGQALPRSPELGELESDLGELVRSRYIPLIAQIQALEVPVVAALNGVAAGAGLGLALAADLRVAAAAAWFSCAFAAIGLVPDSGCSYFLPQYLGLSRALQLAMTNEPLSVSEALSLGLVARVFPQEEFETGWQRFADRLAAGPTRALGLTKRALRRSAGSSLEEQLKLEAELQQLASQTADFREGLAAFREKRPAQFTGR